MDIRTGSYTIVTTSIELAEDEMFIFKRSSWTPARRVSRLTMEWDHFKMFERDKHGTVHSISRDGFPQNVHFTLDDVNVIPPKVRKAIQENMAKLKQEFDATHLPAGMLF